MPGRLRAARLAPALLFCVLLAAFPATARLRVHAVEVDGKGMACVRASRPQIFDEIGGKASLGVDPPAGLAVLDTDLTLPEEAGDISGDAYLGLHADALSTVGDFTYRPLKRRQMRLDIDNHSVADENHASGVNRLTVNYPLALEQVGARLAHYLARTSYSVTGRGRWSHYTEALGTFKVRVQDPDLRREPSDIRTLAVRVMDHDAITDIFLHYDVAKGSETARMLQSGQALEFIFQQVLAGLGIRCRDFRVENVRSQGVSTEADVRVSLYNLRQRIAELVDEPLRRHRFKGIRPQDVSVAVSTMIQIEFPRLDLLIHRRSDRFDVDVSVSTRKVDQCIVGYLRLMEVLQPALVEAGTRNQGLSALTRSINAVETRRFRDVVIAAASSQDGGTFEYALQSAFPRGRVQFSQSFQYHNVLQAYAFASRMMHVPSVSKSYSRLQIHTTAGGLKGHFLYEAEGPWLEAEWSLAHEAAQGIPTMQPWFKTSANVALKDGRVHLALNQSRVKGAGWLAASDLTPLVRDLLASGSADPVAVRMRYDAAGEPGRIPTDLYLRAPTATAVAQAVARAFGPGLKLKTVGKVKPPPLARPDVDIPARLAGEIEADRKFLGVHPSHPAVVGARRPVLADLLRRYLVWYAAAVALLVVAGGLALALLARASRRPSTPSAAVATWPPPPGSAVADPADPLAHRAAQDRAPATAPVESPPSPTPPARPTSPGADARTAFQHEMTERIMQACPDCSVREKDVLELYVSRDGATQVVDVEPLFYLCCKPGINREQAIQSFLQRLL